MGLKDPLPADDTVGAMRKILLALACLLTLAVAPSALAAKQQEAPPAASSSWASQQIATVVAAGLLAPDVASFRPDDPLTAGELAEVLTALGGAPAVSGDPPLPVTISELNAALVRHLGLSPAAKQFRTVLLNAGLAPPKRAGTDIVARGVKLRPNHSPEALELGPNDPATRAEAAFSVARVLELVKPGSWEVASIKSQAAAFALPTLSEWQRRILARATSFIGWPYVWAGSSERPQSLYAGQAPGGFDCSGFVWRVFKLEPFPDAPQLAGVLKGRTTYTMSAEVPVPQRLVREALLPADVVFFGDSGPKSKPAQVGHMGIYLGNGWFIHSSSGAAGVTVSPLSGWYADRYAWGRRPLAEAGLDTTAPAAPVQPVEPAEPDPADAVDPAATADPTDPTLLAS